MNVSLRIFSKFTAWSRGEGASHLVVGAVVANAVTVLVMPVLTRIYSPHDFSILATFTALFSILGVVACLRYEIAIPLEADEARSAHLVTLCVLVSAGFSIAIFGLVQLFRDDVAVALNQPELAAFLWLVPVAVLLFAWMTVAQMWMLRSKQFKKISQNRVLQALIAALFQVGGGLLRLGIFPLVVGQIIKNSFGVLLLGGHVIKSVRKIGITARELRVVARKYHRLPKYSVIESLCNTAAMQAPLLMVAQASAGPEAGYLILGMTVMQAPMSLIGGALGQGFLSRAGEHQRAGTLASLVEGSVANLLRTGVGPLLAAGILAPLVFPFVFGSEWVRAGVLVSWMTPWFVAQFLAAPISMGLYASGHERSVTAVHAFGLVIRLGLVTLASMWLPAYASEAYCIGGALHYTLFLAVIWHFSGFGSASFMSALKDAQWMLVGWLAVTTFMLAGWWLWKSIH